MPRWDLFAGVTIVLTVALLGLARATQAALTDPAPGSDDAENGAPHEGLPSVESAGADPAMPLLANAALSHGLLGGVLVAAAWYARLPRTALGLTLDAGALAVGVALGIGLYAANEAAAAATEWSGIEHSERLRELLAPGTPAGWAVLLVVVLPTVAGVEELLFRAALIGALGAGYGLSPWLLAVVSSVLFGLGHGLQGPGGVLVTGSLGFVLAAAFVLTGSLPAVIVAHYLVNALEFVVHEGIGVEWA